MREPVSKARLAPDSLRLSMMAAWMETGTTVDHASSVTVVATLAIALSNAVADRPTVIFMVLALLLALIEKYYAVRVKLDARLFVILAQCPDQVDAFDQVIEGWSGSQKTRLPRTIEDRWIGARRLWWRQTMVLGAQCCIPVAVLTFKFMSMK